jgi:DNA mismatch repair protein MutS
MSFSTQPERTTPLMQQYYALKQKYSDAVLFFRLGDFYEMFDEDAKQVSALIGLTLTHRNGQPMCGVPYHASEIYIAKLLNLGFKIALCEQLSQPGKGLVERDVVEILTPGSILSPDLLESDSGNYLCALGKEKNCYSFAYTDLSTGEFVCFSTDTPPNEWLSDELDKLQAREIILNEELFSFELAEFFKSRQILLTRYPSWLFSKENALKQLKHQFNVINLKAFGFDEEDDGALPAVGALLEYAVQISHKKTPHLNKIQKKQLKQGLILNEEARSNLEIVRNSHSNDTQFTLLSTLNRCVSPMGSRLLKSWMLNPLNNKNLIEERLNRVEFLGENYDLAEKFRSVIKDISDLERLAGRLAMDKAHGKDLLAIKQSLKALIEADALLPAAYALNLLQTDEIEKIIVLLEKELHDDPAVTLNEGRLIKTGFSEKLDTLRELSEHSLTALENYTNKERAETGINLRLKENRVIGFYFEVSKQYADKLPPYFIRKQSMTSGERFITLKLQQMQTEIQHAKENAIELEKELFLTLRSALKERLSLILEGAHHIAAWDVWASLAKVAAEQNYVRPRLHEGIGINISGGRHPVIEYNLKSSSFVPNSFCADSTTSTLLITGPNMAGKSTYLRQNALIVFMAQIGSFVSADMADIGLVDQIFCRVGASDNLTKGESTFLVEMIETARILQQATPKSLVIMDEVGRGTGSDDGLAIAWAVLEALANNIRALTLFATHYHELTRLENPHIKNYSLRVKDENGQIYFLKQITEGPAEGSYGIHVARLAGIPSYIADRAEAHLNFILENKTFAPNVKKQPPSPSLSPKKESLLFNEEELLSHTIKSFSVDTATPLDALNFIAMLQKKL